MDDAERFRLLGQYRTPRFRIGQRTRQRAGRSVFSGDDSRRQKPVLFVRQGKTVDRDREEDTVGGGSGAMTEDGRR
jgi:hypothetical protein